MYGIVLLGQYSDFLNSSPRIPAAGYPLLNIMLSMKSLRVSRITPKVLVGAKVRASPVRFQASDQTEVAARKVLKGSCIVEIAGKKTITTAMSPVANSNASLQNYMEHASEHFANMELPLGGRQLPDDALMTWL